MKIESSSSKPDQSKRNKTGVPVVYNNVEEKILETTTKKVDTNCEMQVIKDQQIVSGGLIGVEQDMTADQDLQGKHKSLNEATNMDVEEPGSVSMPFRMVLRKMK
jgi:hypothetical protein